MLSSALKEEKNKTISITKTMKKQTLKEIVFLLKISINLAVF